MDQHIKISEYKRDIEKLLEEKVVIEKKHFQEINLLKINIGLLQKDKAELKSNNAALNRALDKMNNDLIETKADLIILRKEYGL